MAGTFRHGRRGGQVRRNGVIEEVPLAHHRRRIDFTGGSAMTVAIAWGDLATAFVSTGIPNIETCACAHRGDRQPRARLGTPLARPGTRAGSAESARGPQQGPLREGAPHRKGPFLGRSAQCSAENATNARNLAPARVHEKVLWCFLAEEQSMAADSKNTRAQSRLEKAAREDEKVRVHYEVEAKIIAEKTARLRALRLAKEAADRTAAHKMPLASKKPKAVKRRPKSDGSLSDWLADQDKMGRRG